MNEWLAPQISLHCPYRILGRRTVKKSWFSRPGTASAFTPRAGIVQQCRTSAAVMSLRVCLFVGSTTRWSLSRRRYSPVVGCCTMYDSKFFSRSIYS